MGAMVDGFEDWYRTVHPRLVTSMAAVFGDPDLAREIADEAIVRAYERWDRVGAMANPAGWVYRVAINVGRRRHRRRSLETRLLRRERIPLVPGPTEDLRLLVADLPPRQQLAVVLRHVGQLSEPEIGEAMGVTRGTVSATLRAAHRTLREHLGEPPLYEGGA